MEHTIPSQTPVRSKRDLHYMYTWWAEFTGAGNCAAEYWNILSLRKLSRDLNVITFLSIIGGLNGQLSTRHLDVFLLSKAFIQKFACGAVQE